MSFNNRGGRPPKPLALHLLHGSYRKDRHQKAGGAIGVAGRVRIPAELQGEAKAFWQRIITPLARVNVVTPLDVPAAIMLCETWSLYKAASAILVKDPIDKDAACAVASYFTSFDRLATKFGLTPTDRERLKVPQVTSPSKFDKFLDRNKARHFIDGGIPTRKRS